MPPNILQLHGTRVFECDSDGPSLASSGDSVAVIGDAVSQGAKVVVIPVNRLAPDFFRLRTGIAGDMLQKFVTYGVRVVILGDIQSQVESSTALRDFVVESNRGEAIWFLPSLEDLEKRIARSGSFADQASAKPRP